MVFLGWKRISAHPSVTANLCKILDQEFSFPSSRERWILLLFMSLKSWTSGQALEGRENFQSLVQKNAYTFYPYSRGRKYTGKSVVLIPTMSIVITFYLQMHSQSHSLYGSMLLVFSDRPSFSFLCSSSHSLLLRQPAGTSYVLLLSLPSTLDVLGQGFFYTWRGNLTHYLEGSGICTPLAVPFLPHQWLVSSIHRKLGKHFRLGFRLKPVAHCCFMVKTEASCCHLL